MAKNVIQDKVELKGIRETNRRLQSLEKSLDSVGKKGLSVGDMMKTGGAQFAVGVAAIGATIAIADRAAQAVGRLVKATHELAMRGGAVAAASSAFEGLASPDLLARINQLSAGLISQQTIYEEGTQILRARILTQDEMAESMGMIANLAQGVGEDVDAMVAQFAQIGSGGGAESISRLGINILEMRREIQEAGISLESTTGRAMLFQNVLEEMRRLTDGNTTTINNYSDAVTAASNRISAYTDDVGEAIAEDQRLVEVVAALEAAFFDMFPEADSAGEAIADMAVAVVQLAADMANSRIVDIVMALTGALARLGAVSITVASFGLHYETGQALWGFADDIAGAADAIDAAAATLEARVDRIGASAGGGAGPDGGAGTTGTGVDPRFAVGDPFDQEFLGNTELVRRSARQSFDPQASGAAAAAQRAGRGRVQQSIKTGASTGGASRSDEYWGASERQAAGLIALLEDEVVLQEQLRQAAEAALDLDQMILVAHREGLDLMVQESMIAEEMAEWNADADAVEAERLTRQEAFLEGRQLELEIAQQQADKEAELADAAETRQKQNIANYAQSASVIGNIFGQIAATQEKAGKAADGWRKAQGVALGIFHTIKAIGAGADAAAAAAKFNFPGMALHIVSAAQHGIAAAMAFSQLAQSGGGGTAKAAASAGGFRPSTSRPTGGRTADDQGNVVNVYSWGRSAADAGRIIQESQYDLERSGKAVRVPRGVGFAA